MESRGRVGPQHGPCDIESAGGSHVRSEVELAPKSAVMQAVWGGLGFLPRRGMKPEGGPRARVGGGPAWSRVGKGSSKRQRRCPRAARPAAGAGGRDS